MGAGFLVLVVGGLDRVSREAKQGDLSEQHLRMKKKKQDATESRNTIRQQAFGEKSEPPVVVRVWESHIHSRKQKAKG